MGRPLSGKSAPKGNRLSLVERFGGTVDSKPLPLNITPAAQPAEKPAAKKTAPAKKSTKPAPKKAVAQPKPATTAAPAAPKPEPRKLNGKVMLSPAEIEKTMAEKRAAAGPKKESAMERNYRQAAELEDKLRGAK